MARTTRGHCRFMRLSIRPVVGLSVLLIGVWGATAEVLAQPGVIKLTYVKSMTLKDGSAGARVKEEGTICIDATCRYRIDRSRGPVRTSEIVDLCKGERISFDPSANIAMVSELPVPLPAPGGRAIVRWSGAAARPGIQSLGTKTIAGGITLTGWRSEILVDQPGHRDRLTSDMWCYMFEDHRTEPIILEERFEDGGSITVREVKGAAQMVNDEGLFSIPAGATVVKQSLVRK
jgi:hypothetical protein